MEQPIEKEDYFVFSVSKGVGGGGFFCLPSLWLGVRLPGQPSSSGCPCQSPPGRPSPFRSMSYIAKQFFTKNTYISKVSYNYNCIYFFCNAVQECL